MCSNQRIDQHVLDQFKVLKKLGSGAYGHVWRVTHSSGEVFALKKVFEAFQHSTDAQRTFREISVLRKLDHPNIIRLHEVFNS
jgi:mitogen-activated protein kinase 15